MKKGQIKNIVINSEKIAAEFLGAGSFSTAYKYNEDVYIYTKVGNNNTDYSKMAIAEWADLDNQHMPQIEKIDSNDDNYYLYRMPFYYPLTAKSCKAWNEYKKLKSAWYNSSDNRFGYIRNQNIINECYNQNVDSSIIDALESINNACTNYDDCYFFEFSPRNLAIDESGNLILLDVIFNKKALLESRKSKY